MIWTHVSEFAIDRLLAGETDPADAAAIRDHAAGCTHCGALYDDALAVQRELAASLPPLGLPVPLRRPRWLSPAIAAGMAAAAGLVFVLAWPAKPRELSTTQVKGTAIAGFYVAHGDAVRRGAVRETVMPGDRIELFTTAVEPAWFAVTSVDGSGQRSIYVTPRPIAAGREQVIPLSIELDGVLGAETVTAMFCPQAFDPLHPRDDCSTDRFTLLKVSR